MKAHLICWDWPKRPLLMPRSVDINFLDHTIIWWRKLGESVRKLTKSFQNWRLRKCKIQTPTQEWKGSRILQIRIKQEIREVSLSRVKNPSSNSIKNFFYSRARKLSNCHLKPLKESYKEKQPRQKLKFKPKIPKNCQILIKKSKRKNQKNHISHL